jgi:uncharacterized BrkB/YihY/UPF0761 family membrane protein
MVFRTMFGGFGLLWLIGLIAVLWALINIAGQKKQDTGWKLIWAIIVLFLNVIGVILYYFISGRKKKK